MLLLRTKMVMIVSFVVMAEQSVNILYLSLTRTLSLSFQQLLMSVKFFYSNERVEWKLSELIGIGRFDSFSSFLLFSRLFIDLVGLFSLLPFCLFCCYFLH